MATEARENQSTQLRPANNQTPMHSPSSRPQLLPSAIKVMPMIGESLKRLCALKNQAQFTAFAIETWAAALSVFPPEVVNMAIIEMALSQDPFPDCGKVIAKCQIEMAKRATTPSQADPAKPTIGTVRAVAKALGIKIV